MGRKICVLALDWSHLVSPTLGVLFAGRCFSVFSHIELSTRGRVQDAQHLQCTQRLVTYGFSLARVQGKEEP
jgi:hypothetical protein